MRRFPAAAALLLAALPAGAADGWTFRAADGGSAGFASNGTYRGLWFACTAGGGARLLIGTGGTRLQRGVDQTAVVTVDGTAFLQVARASDDGEPALDRRLPPTEFRQLAEALAKGKAAEVSMPAGRFALPLAGSGRALKSLLAACS
ncbi:hypothetical protein [Aureimonas leprariae]|uniref:Invasion associated locus B family protein n=1 Tax=Plantimonas leprariae TaxID=2615207 RepID=A0A7V7PT97_9HYPH|nr:hypothetical protein [Aureimonas leprariae]KAB0682833.1 hypothetical protein F6X38_01760 [Aureimonas leprariae]